MSLFDSVTAREDATSTLPAQEPKSESVDNRVAIPSRRIPAVSMNLAKSPNKFDTAPGGAVLAQWQGQKFFHIITRLPCSKPS